MSNVVSREVAAEFIASIQKEGKKVGFTSGVFDLLHPGHTDYLEKARAECDALVVGVNSDSSVRENKGDSRPICSEKDRASVVAALRSVDKVFIFSEKNNNKNIELLKPAIYLKAGDYDRAKLSSASLVEAYGGRIVIVPFLPGYSTTSTIERIISSGEASTVSTIQYDEAPAVFLDRDGTIIEHVEYLHEPEKLKVIPGALEAMKKLKDAGYRIVVVTNQPGIGLGYFTKEDFYKVNRELLRASIKAGVPIDKVYFCPHNEADNCACRKPKTAMIDRAVSELNVKREGSFVIGDMTIDVKLGQNAKCKAIQVKTGFGGDDKRVQVTPDFTANSLVDAAEWILSQSTEKNTGKK